MELPTIDEVKNDVAQKYDYNTWDELVKGEMLAEDYDTLRIYIEEAMKAYGEKLLDYCAEKAKTKEEYQVSGWEENNEPSYSKVNVVDKDSILSIKKEIK